MLIGDCIDVFRKGKSVANPKLWKDIGATSSATAGLVVGVLGIASVLGYRIDLTNETIQALAYGIAGVLYLFNSGVHIVTSDKVGILSDKPGTSSNTEPITTGNPDATRFPDILSSRG